MFVLDTNVISELRRAKRADAGLRAWAEETPFEAMYLSVATISEIERGVLLKSRRDPAGGDLLRDWFENYVLVQFSSRILPIDIAVARRCAALHVPVTRPDIDALIAATALVHGMAVVTRNVRDFEGLGVKVVCPWG